MYSYERKYEEDSNVIKIMKMFLELKWGCIIYLIWIVSCMNNFTGVDEFFSSTWLGWIEGGRGLNMEIRIDMCE